ncbi:MAG: adenylate/guanylate cyclase domain-containing protein [Fibrobacter sp.]|nr:adenylate/guanylate cyclase domain-containing protein [Fibrobacter sp.]
MALISSRLQKRKIKSIAFYICGWMFFSLLFFFFHFYGTPEATDLTLILTIIQFSIFTGLSHGVYDVIVLRDDHDPRPVIGAFLIRLWYFTATVFIDIAICILVQNWYKDGFFIDEQGLEALRDAFQKPAVQSFAIYGVFCGYFITFIRSVNKKFGPNVFINAVLGKTQNPTEVELVFMFVDLRHSTHLAEQMGHIKYSRFLKEYYRLLSNCCEENGGDIYQIAGDGVYLTWPLSACRKKPNPVLCFDDLKRCFFRTRRRFRSQFGAYPTFKAAAHWGKVTMTEVGNFRSEMAYHGDAINTTSRLQDLCGMLGEEFLISKELLDKLPNVGRYHPLPKGSFELKGKSNETCVYALRFMKPDNSTESVDFD